MAKVEGFETTKCRGCGAEIFFAFGVPWFAKRVPILVEMGPANVALLTPQKTTGWVSHFVNCPNAGEFSGSKKKAVG